MPKFIAHAATGAIIVAAVHPRANLKNKTPIFIGSLLALSADFDFALEWFFNLSEIHRGFTHSLIFSAFIGAIIWFIVKKNPSCFPSFSAYGYRNKAALVFAFSFAYLSHALLDFATSTGESGVKLFFPLSNRYYNLGLTKMFELPIGTNLYEVFRWVSIEVIVFVPILFLVLLLKRFTK